MNDKTRGEGEGGEGEGEGNPSNGESVEGKLVSKESVFDPVVIFGPFDLPFLKRSLFVLRAKTSSLSKNSVAIPLLIDEKGVEIDETTKVL